jgi:hypothetical protein
MNERGKGKKPKGTIIHQEQIVGIIVGGVEIFSSIPNSEED